MVDYNWPPPEKRSLLGERVSRLDGPVKSSGAAKYPSDTRREGMLVGKFLTCPHAHAKIVSIDASKARSLPGVKAVRVIQGEGSEIQWAHDEIACVAAVTEDVARDAVRAIEIEYEVRRCVTKMIVSLVAAEKESKKRKELKRKKKKYLKDNESWDVKQKKKAKAKRRQIQDLIKLKETVDGKKMSRAEKKKLKEQMVEDAVGKLYGSQE